MKKSGKIRRIRKGGSPKTQKVYRISPSNPELQTKITMEDVDEVISNVIHSEDSLKVPKSTRKYLVTIMNNKKPDEIRELDKIEDDEVAGFGFKESTSNKQMLKRILTEIVELSVYHTRDYSKNKTVNEKIIKKVLDIKENEYIKRLVEP